MDQGVAPAEIGVAARSNVLAQDAISTLRRAGIPTTSLADEGSEDVAVGSMHRMKGLEFRCVAVVGVTADQVPPASAVTPENEDRIAHAHDLQRERCLLLVAVDCTRAANNSPSPGTATPVPSSRSELPTRDLIR
jgi:superfamily I DNA/RNA helicase